MVNSRLEKESYKCLRRDLMKNNIYELQQKFLERGYILLSDVYLNNKQNLVFKKDGYYYYNSYNGFIKTDNPKKWGVHQPFSLVNLNTYLSNDNATCTLVYQDFDINNVKLQCQCGNIYDVSLNNLIRKKQYQCPQCGRTKSAYNHKKIDKRDSILFTYKLTPVEYCGNIKSIGYFLTHDGFYIKTSLYSVEHCSNYRDTIFNIKNKYSFQNMLHYIDITKSKCMMLSTQYVGMKQKYMFQCGCGKTFDTSWHHFVYSGKRQCKHCSLSTSRYMKMTEEWLCENNIMFVSEHSFNGCKYKHLLRFDYYLPQHNMVIEVDGEQHYKPIRFHGASEEKAKQSFYDNQIRDNIKNIFCQKHNIPILRLAFTDFINDKYKVKLQTFIG